MKRMNGTTHLVTTQSQVFSEMVKNYLSNLYPVTRVKVKKKFKRGVIINGSEYLIPKDNMIIFSRVYDELKLLYALDDEYIIPLVKSFYGFD